MTMIAAFILLALVGCFAASALFWGIWALCSRLRIAGWRVRMALLWVGAFLLIVLLRANRF